MKIFRIVTTLLVTLGLLSGCGGEGGSSTADSGALVIGITDAEGDFLAYAVDVTSIKLTHANGWVVETLPQSSRIDFAQYVDLTEFVTAATVPNGRYTKAALVLDYSNADIQVEVAGQPVQAIVQDGNGEPITTREVEVTLDGDHPLVIAPGLAKHLTLDFDLQTSNSVDTSVNPPVVTAEPLLVADVEMDNPKPHRLRGLLQAVDQGQNLIQLQLRPFHRHDGDFGGVDAYVNDSTRYEIDGVAYSGSSGLAQLALQPLASWIVLLGEINATTRQFVASEVYAGSSLPGSSQDAVAGVVTARSGDQLTVRARTIVRADGSLIFNREVTVVLDGDTTVTRQLSNDVATIGDISVGQRLDLLGTITDNAGVLTLADTNHARLMLTYLSGTAVSVNSGELVVNLQYLEGVPAAEFNFAGTGTSAPFDADPSHYQIDTSTLGLGALQSGDPVRLRGFVTPFGQAPADFTAHTIVGLGDATTTLVAQWKAGGANPFISSSEAGLVVDLSGSHRHHVQRCDVRTDLSGETPTLQPATDGQGRFAIHGGGPVQLYTSFSAFEAALSQRLVAGGKVKRLTATGRFNDATVTLTARTIKVMMKK